MLNFSHKKVLALFVFVIFLVTPMSAVGLTSQPAYLVTVNDLPSKTWTNDVSYAVGNGWYIDFMAPNGAVLSIQPQDYPTQADAINAVSKVNASSLEAQSTGEMFYAFPNFRFDFSA